MAGAEQGQVRQRREVIPTNAFMKITFHTITAVLLLTLSAMAEPFLEVRTERQRAIIDAQFHQEVSPLDERHHNETKVTHDKI